MTKSIAFSEVLQHTKEDDLWLIINKKVYDVTKFVDLHPGGVDTLTGVAGKDGTDEFNSVGHSESAKEELEKYYIGDLNPDDLERINATSSVEKSKHMNIAILCVIIAVVLYFIFAP